MPIALPGSVRVVGRGHRHLLRTPAAVFVDGHNASPLARLALDEQRERCIETAETARRYGTASPSSSTEPTSEQRQPAAGRACAVPSEV
jgi:hypothetical protein